MRSIIDSQGFEVTEADCYEPRMGYCSGCGEECEIVNRDESFDYSYGSINGTHVQYGDDESDCCGEPIVKGGESVVRRSIHIARRDHKDGTVKKGEVYFVKITHHWIEGKSWITEEKRVLKYGPFEDKPWESKMVQAGYHKWVHLTRYEYRQLLFGNKRREYQFGQAALKIVEEREKEEG
jgi:hypothetical protein